MSESTSRILLVEDEGGIREQIEAALRADDWQIDQFSDVQSAKEGIDRAHAQGWSYDAAIIDLFLPRNAEDRKPKLDETLCRDVRPCALVWHISAHFNEEGGTVEEHIRRYHSPDELRAMIPKTPGFIGDLCEQVTQALGTRRIKATLAALQVGASESVLARRFRPDPADSSNTNLIAELCADIKRFWKDLTPAFQEELQGWCDIRLNAIADVETVYPK